MVAVTREEAPYFGCFNERKDFQQVAMMREDSLPPMAIGLSICPVLRGRKTPQGRPHRPPLQPDIAEGDRGLSGEVFSPHVGTFPGPSEKSL